MVRGGALIAPACQIVPACRRRESRLAMSDLARRPSRFFLGQKNALLQRSRAEDGEIIRAHDIGECAAGVALFSKATIASYVRRGEKTVSIGLGLTRAARRAGIQQARNATAANKAAMEIRPRRRDVFRPLLPHHFAQNAAAAGHGQRLRIGREIAPARGGNVTLASSDSTERDLAQSDTRLPKPSERGARVGD